MTTEKMEQKKLEKIKRKVVKNDRKGRERRKMNGI